MRKLLGKWAMVCGLLCFQTAHAQFWERLGNPMIAVPVEHPPTLNLQVDRIVFGPATGQCSDRRREEAQAKTLRNGDVIEMAKQGIPISVIVTKVQTSEHDFDTSTAGIIALVKAGVDEDVVNAMIAAE